MLKDHLDAYFPGHWSVPCLLDKRVHAQVRTCLLAIHVLLVFECTQREAGVPFLDCGHHQFDGWKGKPERERENDGLGDLNGILAKSGRVVLVNIVWLPPKKKPKKNCI